MIAFGYIPKAKSKTKPADSVIAVTSVPLMDLPAFMEDLGDATQEWELRAAKGECGWICADCCVTFPAGMPAACEHGHVGCTQIIQRNKFEAEARMQRIPLIDLNQHLAIQGVELKCDALTTYGRDLCGCRRATLSTLDGKARFTVFQWADGTIYRIQRI